MIQTKEKTWTKELVQEHAIVAVLIEMYTLPFYLTVLTSIKETKDKIYQAILSVCIEEMLHLQLAANLCLALDISNQQIFQKPIYGKPVPYLKPDDPDTKHHKLVNAQLGPLNKANLDTMLDIETPSEFDSQLDQTTPQYPYATIGQMYDALLKGILAVEKESPVFGWSTKNQQAMFTYGPNYDKNALRINQTIASFGDAQEAVNLICGQGEGLAMLPLPQPPFTAEQFPVEEAYRFFPKVKYNSEEYKDPEPDDPAILNRYSHYGRFLWVQNQIEKNGGKYPETYETTSGSPSLEQSKALTSLDQDFDSFFALLTSIWGGGNTSEFFPAMTKLLTLSTNCWQAGVIPQWSKKLPEK